MSLHDDKEFNSDYIKTMYLNTLHKIIPNTYYMNICKTAKRNRKYTYIWIFYLAISKINRWNRQNISKNIGKLKNTVSRLHLMSIWNIPHSRDSTVFSYIHGHLWKLILSCAIKKKMPPPIFQEKHQSHRQYYLTIVSVNLEIQP